MDRLSTEQRHYNMSRIKHKDTKPELIVRKLLWRQGYRYRLHRRELPGVPDIVFSGKNKVIFIHGCFWHKHDCKKFSWPKTNESFWKHKIHKNVERDRINEKLLREKGWQVLIIWECQIEKRGENSILLDILRSFLR